MHNKRTASTRVYRCFGNSCKNPDKEWPRKDNFRSHLTKTHPNEDPDLLLKQSEAWWSSHHVGNVQPEDSDLSQPEPDPSAIQPAGYAQYYARPTTPHYQTSNPDSGYQPTTSPYTPPNLSVHPYPPRDVNWGDSLMPNIQQRTDQPNRRLLQQRTNVGGYVGGDSSYMTSRVTGGGSSRWQLLGNMSTRNQLRTQGLRPSLMAAPQFSGQNNFGGHQISYSQLPGWQTNIQGLPSQMLRSTSGNQDNVLPIQREVAAPLANTVADPLFLEQDRLEQTQDWDELGAQVSASQDYPSHTDVLSQIGHAGAELVSQMPINTPQNPLLESDVQPTGDNSAADFSVEHLTKFMQRYANKVGNDQERNAIRFAAQSLESTTGAASSELSLTDRQADDHIEEVLNEASKTVYRCKYPNCKSNKDSWGLRSEIRKHMKRHTKPFGCTYEKCYKRFGSKSDWMRHELKRHTQQEYWRCAIHIGESGSVLQPCCEIFGKKEQFTNHLDDVHHLQKSREVNTQVMQQHINAGFQPQYWCGFCKEIQKLSKKGKEGYHERYDHIAKHISEEERCIDDWVPPNERVSKREVQARQLQERRQKQNQQVIIDGSEPAEDDIVGHDDSTGEESSSSTSPSDQVPAQLTSTFPTPSASQPHIQHRRPHQPAASATTSTNRKRSQAAAGLPQHQNVRRVANFWVCHLCGFENLLATSPGCGSCQHLKCDGCNPVFRHVREDFF